jgi:quercetin dioxygenase-like cupin family protein
VRAESVHGLLLEVEFPAGVSTPPHRHDQDSHVVVLHGELVGQVGDTSARLGPGDVQVHPAGVVHSVEAVSDCRWLEFKAPAPTTLPNAQRGSGVRRP